MFKKTLFLLTVPNLMIILSGCMAGTAPLVAPGSPPLAKELTLYNWADYMPPAVLDKFTAEYGVKVNYLTYNSQEEAVANIQAGKIGYDVAVIEYNRLPSLIAANLLAELDYEHLPEIKNISADFRDLAFDPGNKYSAPYSWGTTGLLVRTDLLKGLVTRWSDLWDPRYAGKIGVPQSPRELISITLKSLNYPLNTADPAQLEAALAHLIKLKPSIRYVSIEPESALKPLLNGEVAILLGWNGEVLLAQEQNSAISYVLPKEGTILWGDNFVISAASPHKYTAELFINFLLRPEISAQIVQTYYYPCANETARQFIDPKLLNNPLVYPPVDYLSESDFYLPLSPEGQKLYDDIWVRFTAASQ